MVLVYIQEDSIQSMLKKIITKLGLGSCKTKTIDEHLAEESQKSQLEKDGA